MKKKKDLLGKRKAVGNNLVKMADEILYRVENNRDSLKDRWGNRSYMVAGKYHDQTSKILNLNYGCFGITRVIYLCRVTKLCTRKDQFNCQALRRSLR
jgi:hypothetical protein